MSICLNVDISAIIQIKVTKLDMEHSVYNRFGFFLFFSVSCGPLAGEHPRTSHTLYTPHYGPGVYSSNICT